LIHSIKLWLYNVFLSIDQCSLYDLVIVGGGIVGCATAREMIMRHPNLKMAIVEKETALAMHETGHYSGVVHAGIYYTPGSMKVNQKIQLIPHSDLGDQHCQI